MPLLLQNFHLVEPGELLPVGDLPAREGEPGESDEVRDDYQGTDELQETEDVRDILVQEEQGIEARVVVPQREYLESEQEVHESPPEADYEEEEDDDVREEARSEVELADLGDFPDLDPIVREPREEREQDLARVEADVDELELPVIEEAEQVVVEAEIRREHEDEESRETDEQHVHQDPQLVVRLYDGEEVQLPQQLFPLPPPGGLVFPRSVFPVVEGRRVTQELESDLAQVPSLPPF